MSDIQKPLMAILDTDDYDAEVVEGTGFEEKTKYQFFIEKPPVRKVMQYGAAKGGLFVLSKKCPEELVNEYKSHPDQFEIMVPGEINGIQALVKGKDFDKFKPYLSEILDITWVHQNESGKRLVFMSVNLSERVSVNPGHPEWESQIVKLSRKLGYIPPEPKNKDGTPNKERFSLSFIHPGLNIMAEVVKAEQKNKDGTKKLVDKLDQETIEVVTAEGKAKEQQELKPDEIDAEVRMNIQEFAEDAKTVSDINKKVKAHLKESGELNRLGEYASAIQIMKDKKEILA
jgi:hypothetical protein